MAATGVALSFAVLLTICACALVAIAFATNNWRQYGLGGDGMANQSKPSKVPPNRPELNYTRTVGFFKICFKEDDYPKNIELADSPLEFKCADVLYNETITNTTSPHVQWFIQMKRLYLSLYSVGLFLCFISLITLIAACARRSHSVLIATGVLLLFAGGFIAAGIGAWHKYLSIDEGELWPKEVRAATNFAYGWSYVVGWVGDGVLFLAAILMFVASCTIQHEDELYGKDYYDSRALVAIPAPASHYAATGDKSVYAQPYGQSPYATGAYMNYPYNTYSPYHYYYAQHYYPYYSLR